MQPRKVFVISDTHFGHEMIRKARGFNSFSEMNKTIKKSWNETVGVNDLVIHLGDVTFSNKTITSEMLNTLNGEKILILGNHDKKGKQWWRSVGFNNVETDSIQLTLLVFKEGSTTPKDIILSHKPILNVQEHILNIHGHIHHLLKDKIDTWTLFNTSRSHYNVCVDNKTQDYKPTLLGELVDIDNKPTLISKDPIWYK